jgi:hypothetical protein
MNKELFPNGSVSGDLLQHGEEIELQVARAEGERAEANKLMSLHQNRGEVVEAKESGANPIFSNSLSHIRRQQEGHWMYPEVVGPVTRANG